MRLLMLHGLLANAREAHVGNACRQGIDAADSGHASAWVAIIGVAVVAAGCSDAGLLCGAVLGIILGVRDSLRAIAAVCGSANILSRGAVLAERRRLTTSRASGTDIESIGGVCSFLLLSVLGSWRPCRRGCLGLRLLLRVLEALHVV